MGDGKKVKFWEDTWVDDRSLKDTYPRLFSISKCKVSIVAKIGQGSKRILYTYLDEI